MSVVSKVGADVRLRCPIDASPPPIVVWEKEGEVIDYTWVRYRANKKTLKIKSSEKGDTGVYHCKAINGFGKVEIRIDLIVIEPSDFPGLSESELPLLAPPVFTAASRDQRTNIVREPGQSISLSCDALGKPSPRISWYKNRELYRDTGSTLVLSDLSARDAGTYTCTAQNVVGDSSLQFNLQIRLDESRARIVYGPLNMTVQQGDTARLDCRVRSSHFPTVKWLRRLAEQPSAEFSEVISVDGKEKYELIETSRLVELGSGEYLSTLELTDLGPAATGLYVCFVTSQDGGGGFNVKPAFINVIKSPLDSSVSVTVLVTTLSLVLLVCSLLLLLCCCNKRKKVDESTGSSAAVEVQKSLMEDSRPIYRGPLDPNRSRDDVKVVVNKMDDLLNQNTQLLASPKKSQYFCDSYEENTYEVPHILPQNLRIERINYYEQRDVMPQNYFNRQCHG